MRRIITALVATVAALAFTSGMALAVQGGGGGGTASPITYTGNGLPLASQECLANANNGGISGDVSGLYLLWNLPGVPSTATNVTITLPDGTHPMQFNGTWKYISGVWDKDTLTNLPVTAQWDGGGTANQLTVSHGCTQLAATSSVITSVKLGDAAVASGGSVALGSQVHDTATLDTTPTGVTMPSTPAGSSITFLFYQGANTDCSGDPVDAGQTVDVSGKVSKFSVDSALSPALHAGDYGYKAIFTSGNENLVKSSTGACEPFTVNKGDGQIDTTIHADKSALADGAFPLGTKVYDTVGFTGVSGISMTADATVTYTFFRGGDCTTGTADTPAETVAAGTGSTVTPDPGLGAGSYAYQASYSGNSDYNAITASACEPLTIDKATLGISTTIHDASHTGVSEVALGTVVHDTATVTGAVAGFPTEAVVFTADGTGLSADSLAQANWPADETAVTARTVDSASLHAGTTYKYSASIAGNDNYIGASSGDESLTVDKATLGISTVVHNASHNPLTATSIVLVGASVHDTATVTGGVTGFALPAVTFTYNGVAIGPALATNPDPPFASADVVMTTTLGDHKFAASVGSNGDYIGALSADEPFIVKAAAFCSPGFWKNASNTAWALVSPITKTSPYNGNVSPNFGPVLNNNNLTTPTIYQVISGGANTYGSAAFNGTGTFLTTKALANTPGYVEPIGNYTASCPISNGGVITPAP